jgi:DNA-directed RNA polymerase subunit RPC12/RpoP
MPTEVETLRDLARAYWAGKELRCPKHPASRLTGSFVQTTYADHLALVCASGKETISIPQRPKQLEFQDQQVEGFVENLQRGDAIRCYRCQSKMEIDAKENRDTGITDYTFTCIRCFSWGRWIGKPELAKIGKD